MAPAVAHSRSALLNVRTIPKSELYRPLRRWLEWRKSHPPRLARKEAQVAAPRS